jgi:NAD(P)-dependent dehydrogenase (short-subunit alcohol dehydrogenase family)
VTRSIDLGGRTVLVAGASSGIGRAIALAAADAGAQLCLFARDAVRLAEVERTISAAGGAVLSVEGDATSPEAAALAVQRVVRRFGRLDVLVNSVGTNVQDRVLSALTLQTWHELIAANLHAAYVLTQAVLPVFRERREGLLLHVSSAAAKRADWSGVGYQAAKAGLVGLAHGTMEEERENGVRVTVLFPGLTDTPLLQRRPVPPTPALLARALQPADVALMCVTVMALPPRAYVPELLIYPSRT